MKDEWKDWTDEALEEYEQRLYDREAEGDNCWELREDVLKEMRRRNMI